MKSSQQQDDLGRDPNFNYDKENRFEIGVHAVSNLFFVHH
jgi:hypothetical protein